MFSICTSAISFAQEFKVIDGKGTYRNITKNNVTTAATEPTSPVEDDVWFDSANNLVKVHDGNTWKTVASFDPDDLKDDQKIDVFNLVGNTLSLSLENDGEATKTLDLTNAGTDDQNLTVTAGATDTSVIDMEDGTDVTLKAGTGITLSEDTGTGTITITGAPSSLWDDDTDTGILVEESPDEDKIRFDTAGSERLILDENGRLVFANPGDFDNSGGSPTSAVVGIDGTTHGRLRLTAGSQDTFSDTEGASIDLHGNSSTSNTGVLDLVAGSAADSTKAAIKFWTNTDGSTQQTSAVITGEGNMGINTTNPTQKLEVQGSVRIDEWIYDENNEKGTAGQVLSSTASGIDWIDVSAASSGTSLAVRATTTTNATGNGKIDYTDEDFDTQNAFDLATDQFKPSVAGYYLINLVNTYNGLTNSGDHAFATYYKNGSSYSAGFTRRITHNNLTSELTELVYLNGSTDYIECHRGSPTGYLDASAFSAVLINEVSSSGSGSDDNLGNHTATENLQLSGNWLSNDGGSEGVFVDTDGHVGIATSTPSDELEVNGTINAKSYKSKIYTAQRTTNFTTSNSNTWADFPDLTQTITLTEEANVMITYNISMYGANNVLVTRLMVNGNVRSKSLSGNIVYWNISSFWNETLAAGTHTIKVQYRTPKSNTFTPSQDWQNAYLQVVVLGNQ